MADEVNVEQRKSGWLDWLKEPKNAVTAAVLVGSLMQDRAPGQSKVGAIGQRLVGTLGFRAGMEDQLRQQGIQNQQLQMQQQENQSVQGYRTGQLAEGAERNRLEQAGQVQQATLSREQMQNAQNVAKIQTAKGPEELAKISADAEEARARASLYQQQANSKEGLFQSPYEAEMFKSWSEGRIAADPTKPPSPAEWLSYIQPYRNANAMAMALMQKGVMPTVTMEKDGSVSVMVPGVGAPGQITPEQWNDPQFEGWTDEQKIAALTPAGGTPPKPPGSVAPPMAPASGGGGGPPIAPVEVTQRKTAFQRAQDEKKRQADTNATIQTNIVNSLTTPAIPQRKTAATAYRRFRMGTYTMDDLATLRAIPKEELMQTFSTITPRDVRIIYGGP